MPVPRTSGALRRPPGRPAVAAAILGVAVVCAFSAYLRFVSAAPLGADTWWHGAVQVTPGSALFAVAVFFAQVGGELGAAVLAAIAAALFLAMRRPRDAAALTTAAGIGIVLAQAAKWLGQRDRPWDPLYGSHGFAFPSGHAMGAAALAVSAVLVARGSERITARLTRWVAVAAIAWIVVMMWSRTALHVHWLTDALGGALLGASAAVLARWLWFRPVSVAARRVES